MTKCIGQTVMVVNIVNIYKIIGRLKLMSNLLHNYNNVPNTEDWWVSLSKEILEQLPPEFKACARWNNNDKWLFLEFPSLTLYNKPLPEQIIQLIKKYHGDTVQHLQYNEPILRFPRYMPPDLSNMQPYNNTQSYSSTTEANNFSNINQKSKRDQTMSEESYSLNRHFTEKKPKTLYVNPINNKISDILTILTKPTMEKVTYKDQPATDKPTWKLCMDVNCRSTNTAMKLSMTATQYEPLTEDKNGNPVFGRNEQDWIGKIIMISSIGKYKNGIEYCIFSPVNL
jgi:hypothetical protein